MKHSWSGNFPQFFWIKYVCFCHGDEAFLKWELSPIFELSMFAFVTASRWFWEEKEHFWSGDFPQLFETILRK